MERADISAPRGARVGAMVAVVLLHIAAFMVLLRAFVPDFTEKVAEDVLATFNVTITAPEPTPTPKAPEKQGAAAPVARKAVPKEVSAPRPRVQVRKGDAAPVSGRGNDTSAGAGDRGAGTGAGGAGSGTGSGQGGDGTGGGAATKAVKIAGDISSTRDYPRETRDLRNGQSVTLALTVASDGSVKGCRVHRPSADAEADRITCQLARQRFRFRPAMNAAGQPVESTYGWQQRWWDPRGGN